MIHELFDRLFAKKVTRKTNQKILIAFYVTILIIQMASEYIMSNAYLIQKRREKFPSKAYL